MTEHRTTAELEAGLAHVQASPADRGHVEMIVARPRQNERRVLEAGTFTVADGLVGDDWRARGSSRTEDGGAHPDKQVTLMNSRFLDLIAGDRSRWPLAGDQLLVDLDVGVDNLAPGDHLAVGDAVLVVTPAAHDGCKKFAARYGVDALKLTATPTGKQLRLRGLYARVVQDGVVRVGDPITPRPAP